MLRRLIASMLLLWLPLQGLAALTMPFCAHSLGAGNDEQTDAADHAHGAHEHGTSGLQHEPADHDSGLACNGCGSCHLACAAAMLPEPVGTAFAPVAGRLDAPPSLAPPALVLDRPNPPPLPRG